MSYIDGFVAAVPASRKQDYIDHVHSIQSLFGEIGVTRMVECWGDDVPEGQVTDFRKAVKAEADEVVVMSWLEWPSKEVRDAGMEKMHTDPKFEEAMQSMPFDGKRVIFGGFEVVFDK